MTVAATTSRADYTGNGVTLLFAVPFYFLDNTHVKIIRTQISTGATTTLALTTDYTLAGAGVSSGGTATMLVAPTADQRLAVLRNVPFTQLIHYVPNDPFPAATHEQALDQLTMEVQQTNETLGRALTLDPSVVGASGALPAPVANAFIGWNANATGFQNYAGLANVTVSSAMQPVVQAANISTARGLLGAAGSGNNTDITALNNPSGIAYIPRADVAGNSTINLSAVADNIRITGNNANISAFIVGAGRNIFATFNGTNTIVNGANLTTPTGGNIATASGDFAILRAPTPNSIELLSYSRSGSAINSGTPVATTSGTSIDFTGIPSWAKRITVAFKGVSTNGTSQVQIQIGSGSINTSGYASIYTVGGTGSSVFSSGYLVCPVAAANYFDGIATLVNMGGNVWVYSASTNLLVSTNVGCTSIGDTSLSGALDRLRITTLNGTDTFDLGSVNIFWE